MASMERLFSPNIRYLFRFNAPKFKRFRCYKILSRIWQKKIQNWKLKKKLKNKTKKSHYHIENITHPRPVKRWFRLHKNVCKVTKSAIGETKAPYKRRSLEQNNLVYSKLYIMKVKPFILSICKHNSNSHQRGLWNC